MFAKPISGARNDRPDDQSDSGSCRQHRADLRRPEPALMKKREEERERNTKCGEQCAVEKQKAIERPKPYSGFG
jgi:hypothetical protein